MSVSPVRRLGREPEGGGALEAQADESARARRSQVVLNGPDFTSEILFGKTGLLEKSREQPAPQALSRVDRHSDVGVTCLAPGLMTATRTEMLPTVSRERPA